MRNLLGSPLKDTFELVHFETGSRGLESPAKDEYIHTKIWRIIASPFILMRRIVAIRPDIVHINTAISHKPFWRDLIYLIVCKLFARKIILQTHGGSLKYLTSLPGMRTVVKLAYSKADAVVLLANSEKQDFYQLGLNDSVCIVPNAVDTRQYARKGARVHSGKVCRLAFISRLIRPKGMFEAMEAVRILSQDKAYQNIKFQIAGSGPDSDEIVDWIRRHEMDKYIELVGALYGDDKIDFLRNSDALVFPTYHPEGLPYVIIESLAAGTPVIATKVGGIPDIVVNGEHGILIEGRSPENIVDAVRELSRSPDALKTMSLKCSAWASEQLGLDRLASDFEKVYTKVAS